MFYYIVAAIILIAILMYFLTELIHLPKLIFKKYLKFILLFILIILVIYLMRFFPAIISTIPAIFLILFRWGNLIKFVAKVFLNKQYSQSRKNSMTRKEALDILGLNANATKKEINDNYQKLMKKNHPDLGGSDWITKKLNEAREILLG
ncbi:MAG: hypothetical protein CMP43_03810 [Rickettsiales bacterium]|nr:hypothetical protein [Rickettsiales bacterium]